jgi:hypothetical protein
LYEKVWPLSERPDSWRPSCQVKEKTDNGTVTKYHLVGDKVTILLQAYIHRNQRYSFVTINKRMIVA